MRTKKMKGIISFVLVSALIVTSLYFNGSKESTKAESSKKKDTKVKVVKELTGERTEYSDTYLLSNGAKRVKIYPGKVRYKEDGNLKEYNENLNGLSSSDQNELEKISYSKASDYEKVNKNGDAKHFFPKDLNDDTGVITKYKKYSIEMAPDLEGKGCQDEKDNKDENDDDSDGDSQKYNQIVTKDNEITYSTKQNSNIEYKYQSLSNGVKENIILKSKPESNVFKYKISGDNITLKQEKNDRGINVIDKSSKKVVGYINPPNIKDTSGEVDYKSISYSLEKEDGNTYLIMSVDEEYLNSSNCKYPVTIDPYMVWVMPSYLKVVGVWGADFYANSRDTGNILPVSNSLMSSYPYGNTEQRVYVSASNILSGNCFSGGGVSLEDKYVVNASFDFSEHEKPAFYPNTTAMLRMKRVLGSWNPNTITWNNQPSIDTNYIAEVEASGVEAQRHNIDITEWAQDVANGTIDDYGFVFTCSQANMATQIYGAAVNYIYENGHPVGTNHMYMSVDYYDFAQYDGSVTMSASSEGNQAQVKVEEYADNDENNPVTGYRVFVRKNDENRFHETVTKTDMSDIALHYLNDISSTIDFRVSVMYQDGTEKLSNIVTLKKTEQETEEETTALEEESTEEEETEEEETYEEETEDETEDETEEEPETLDGYTFEETTIDTDGDGLEDGYEVWDFKTLWKTETSNSTEQNPEYDVDTDNDGLPDGYEVFYQGTNPKESDTFSQDSDDDMYSDLEEYANNTDPHLSDSDFDNVTDFVDSTPRKTNSQTSNTIGIAAQVQMGLYDVIQTETDSGVTYTNVVNVYSGQVKRIYSNYGNSNLNKEIKYFYDAKGNNTAVVECYDSSDPNSTSPTVITYTYDSNNNNTYICDKKTQYDMTYDSEGSITNFKVGGNTIVSGVDTNITNNITGNTTLDDLSVGDIITKDSHEDTFANNSSATPQKIKSITTSYKTDSDTQTATKVETFYGNDTDPSYETNINSDGKLLSFYDYTQDPNDPVEYTYTYNENVSTVTRSDDFSRTITETEDTENNKSIKTTVYSYKDVDNQTVSDTIVSEYPREVAEGDPKTSKITFNNNDYYEQTISADTKTKIEDVKCYSLSNASLIKNTIVENNNNSTTEELDVKIGTDQTLDYTYDNAGNITKIEKNNDTVAEYSYDAHGRMLVEKDYNDNKYTEYSYNDSGNTTKKAIYDMDSSGDKITSTKVEKNYTYGNSSWPDQMTSYNGDTVTYDDAGNPLNYINDRSFEWENGRNLKKVKLLNTEIATYKYNQNGLRTYKDAPLERVYYEWDDENKLVRELVYKKNEGKYYDVWYIYNSDNEMIGYRYSYMYSSTQKTTRYVYFEKNLQGDVIGLVNLYGKRIVSYTYDAWGNVIDETATMDAGTDRKVNHIKYRGYYQDDETHYYYLQSRFYDSTTGRFLNADSVIANKPQFQSQSMVSDNYYTYCNSNPVFMVDKEGMIPKKRWHKYNYKRGKVKKYIDKHWNEKYLYRIAMDYPYFLGRDCTNFASQCMVAGKMEISSSWYCVPYLVGLCIYTRSWISVTHNRSHVKKYFLRKSANVLPKANTQQYKNFIKKHKPKKGDILYFYNKKKKRYSHTAVISKVSKSNIYYSAHSKSRYDVELKEVIKNSEYSHVEVCMLNTKGKYYD